MDEESLSYNQKAYAKRSLSGLCVKCQKTKPLEGKKYCDLCKKVIADYARKKKQKFKEEGSCFYCGFKTTEPNQESCTCKKEIQKLDQAKRIKRIENGCCARCNQPNFNGLKNCDKCLCKTASRRKIREQDKKENGLCIRCGINEAIQYGSQCDVCTFKSKSASRTRSRKEWEKIKNFWNEKGGTCAYTGRSINLLESELDHIYPHSLGGTNDVDNLQWLYSKVNWMKGKLLEEEFLQLVKEIYLHCKSSGKIN